MKESTPERRDYEKNGIGWHQPERRRQYDTTFLGHCISCDLRNEVKTKMSWRHFTVVMGIIGAFISAIIAVSAPTAVRGFERLVDTNKETLEAVHKISDRTSRIETRQEMIMKGLNIGGDNQSNRWGRNWDSHDAIR